MPHKSVLLALEVLGIGISGPDTWAYRLLLWLRDSGVEVRVAVLLRANADESAVVVRLLQEAAIPMAVRRISNMRADTQWFMEQARAFLPGLFIAHAVPAALMAAMNLRQFGIRSAMMIHSVDPYYSKLINAFVFSGAQPAVNVVVTVSEYLKQQLQPHLRNRVKLENIHCGAPMAQGKAKWNGEDFHLLYVGRFCQYPKRVVDVAKAFCAACEQIPRVHATLVGDGPDRDQVAAVLQSRAGGKKVRLTGALPLPEVQALLPTAHAIVLMSDFEGNPIALMEGMSVGLVPVVTAMPSGIPELVFEGETGLIIADREEAFVAAIRRMCENPEYWRAMSAAAHQRFNDYCAPSNVVAAWCREIGEQPEPFTMPKKIDLPVYSWFDFWVDSSMGRGIKQLRCMVQRTFWDLWDGIPTSLRVAIRSLAKAFKFHDGFRLRKSEEK